VRLSRLFLDVSSLVRWTGPPVGIARVEHALARAARTRPDSQLCLWDQRERHWRSLRPDWADLVLDWNGAVDVLAANQSILSRQGWFSALERLRLLHPRAAALAGALQRALLAVRRHGHRLHDSEGRRIAYVPPDLALGGDADIGPGDVLFSAGSDWFHLDAAALREVKRRLGFRYVCFCYDLIPITHPHFYAGDDVALVTRHWRATLPIADLVITTARCIAADLAAFAAAEGIPPPATAVLPLGYDPPSVSPGKLPPGLVPGRYALFVSTIEPRKGHALLLRVWNRLRPRCFTLVCVGRPGWMVDDVLRGLAATEGVLHLQGVGDDALGALYAHAAFCLYPSHYEGFGLPVIEALARGKAVLASSGGALPETIAGAFSCLDPADEAAWERTIAAWIADPPTFPGPLVHPDWATAASAILDQAAAVAPSKTK